MILLRRIFFVLFVVFFISLIGAQIASGFLLKPLLERQGERLFQVPVSINQAGANLFNGSLWMKGVRIKNAQGFQESDFLTARTISVDLSILSLLTSEFVLNRILLKDPAFTFETNEQGQLNTSVFLDRILAKFQKMMDKKPKLLRLITKFMLGKFAVRNGTVQMVNRSEAQMDFNFKSISFSLARLVYPPDPEEALPIALYINATAPGTTEGKILVLGRLNFFTSKKSFDITGSAKGLAFSQYGVFFQDFPLLFKEGTLQFKSKALCHENQVDIYNQVRLDGLRFTMKKFPKGKTPLAFGFAPATVAHFFNELQPAAEPFEFDFHVTGDLSDPEFNVFLTTVDRISQTINERLANQMKAVAEQAKQISQGDIAELAKVSLSASKMADPSSGGRGAERRSNP